MLGKTELVKFIILFFVIATISQSCVKHRDLITLNAKDELYDDLRSDKISQYNRHLDYTSYKIQAFDLLMIKINSFGGNTEEFLSREFAPDNTYSRQIGYDPASLYFNSYSVNDSGFVYLPVIGEVKVTGVTVNELKLILDEAFSPYLTYANTNVKLANSRITIIGEVTNPGLHYLYNERNTLLDAISLAGDFTDFSNRKKVKVIRQTEVGTKSTYVNLYRSDFLSSEYFYVQPNDVIYVEPLKQKSWDVSAKTLGVIISGISLASLIINIFK